MPLPYVPQPVASALAERAEHQRAFLGLVAGRALQLPMRLTGEEQPRRSMAFEAHLRAAEMALVADDPESGKASLQRAAEEAWPLLMPAGEAEEAAPVSKVAPTTVALAAALASPRNVVEVSDTGVWMTLDERGAYASWDGPLAALLQQGGKLIAAAAAQTGTAIETALSLLTGAGPGDLEPRTDDETHVGLLRHALGGTPQAGVLPLFGLKRDEEEAGRWRRAEWDRLPEGAMVAFIALHQREQARLLLLGAVAGEAANPSGDAIERGVPLIDMALLGLHVGLRRSHPAAGGLVANRAAVAGVGPGYAFYDALAEGFFSRRTATGF